MNIHILSCSLPYSGRSTTIVGDVHFEVAAALITWLRCETFCAAKYVIKSRTLMLTGSNKQVLRQTKTNDKKKTDHKLPTKTPLQ